MQHPRKPPASGPSSRPPPDLRPCKVVSAAQAPHPREGSPSAPGVPHPGLLSTFELRSTPLGGHGDRPAASPAATGCPPARHARPHPGARRRLSPRTSREGREQGTRTLAGRTCRTGPDPSATASPRPPAAAAATPARPAPFPPQLPTAGSGPHSGSRDRSSAGSSNRRHFPAAPRLRVPGATSAKACAPRWQSLPGRSACWEL